MRHRIVLYLLFILSFIIFISLGKWQLNRAHNKQQMIELFDYAKTSILANPQEIKQYQNYILKGKFYNNKTIIYDNQIQDSKVGFNVLTLFVIENTNIGIFINRGFAPWGKSRTNINFADVKENVQQITARARKIVNRMVLKYKNNTGKIKFPLVQQSLNFAKVNISGVNIIQDYYFELDNKNINCLKCNWVPYYGTSVAKHKAYALQWFTFAATAFIIFLVLYFRNKYKKSKE